MFKRVEKRRRKKEEEEELGLDEDMKEVLGIHDTDSEESNSESDPEPEGASDSDVEEGRGLGEEGDEGEGEGEETEEEEKEEDPSITVAQALQDPIYVVSVLPEVKACIVCPGKLLKGVKMVQLHRTSNAHERRLKTFKKLAANADSTGSAWEVLKQHAEDKPKLSLVKPSTTSKRAEKKEASKLIRKARREKAKEKAQAKKAAEKQPAPADDASASKSLSPKKDSQVANEDKPAKKKRKVGDPTNSPRKKKEKDAVTPFSVEQDEPKKAGPATEAVKSIVKSTHDRAKAARSRASSISKAPRRKPLVAS
ncbi:hypothetical protein K443DRAFT_136083 [Laccaria amethystina LaAM-08-1]|uniref:Uncharacterized protein n=1 Tax=Laccaria amethystina LaAM-08-1 TaxID=1095629 RepID=A0A0C9Y7N8_9AGAR|nr:hypothetical protein K443DRAFT_136083 [Laccaria amethystina LaAM-08-1]